MRQIAATNFCHSDNDFHDAQGDLLQQPVVMRCRSDLSAAAGKFAPNQIKSHIEIISRSFIHCVTRLLIANKIGGEVYSGDEFIVAVNSLLNMFNTLV